MAWKKPNMLDYQNDNLYQEFIKHFNWEKASIIDYAYNKQCKKDLRPFLSAKSSQGITHSFLTRDHTKHQSITFQKTVNKKRIRIVIVHPKSSKWKNDLNQYCYKFNICYVYYGTPTEEHTNNILLMTQQTKQLLQKELESWKPIKEEFEPTKADTKTKRMCDINENAKSTPDFSKLPIIDDWKQDPFANYSGQTLKDGFISPENEKYMVKYPDNRELISISQNKTTKHIITEYIASQILKIAGFDVQETILALQNGELVVACKNFIPDESQLIEFSKFNKKYAKTKIHSDYPDMEQLMHILKTDPLLKPYADTLEKAYAKQLVADALIGTTERNMNRFGYLVDKNGNVKPAPMYSNGYSMSYNLSEKNISQRWSLWNIDDYILTKEKAPVFINKTNTDFYHTLISDSNPYLKDAVIEMVPIIKNKLPEIKTFIERERTLSKIQKTYYKEFINTRFIRLLNVAYIYWASNS